MFFVCLIAYLFSESFADIATSSNALRTDSDNYPATSSNTADLTVKPENEKATDSNAKRYEVNLDGITVIVEAPHDAFESEVALKVQRIIGNESINKIISENSADIGEVEEGTADISDFKEDTEENKDHISVDIHFEDENNVEIEPLTPVYVNIKIDNEALPEGIKPEDTSVYHIKDDESITKIENVEFVENKEDKSITTNFSTESFSIFTITWGGAFSIKVKYVDTAGNEITADLNKIEIYRNHSGVFNNNADKITPKQLDTGIPGMKYKYAVARMANGSTVNNILQIERDPGIPKGLRYTVNGSDWVQFAPNEMRFLELVYEPENSNNTKRNRIKIDKSKTVEDPDKDGIYDLKLEINNQTGNSGSKTNVDILFLGDTTNTMSSGIEHYGSPKISAMYNSIRRFVNTNYLEADKYDLRYAFVGINAEANVYSNWTANKSSMVSSIPFTPINERRTNYEKGFAKANELFMNGRSDAIKVLVFLTDGNPSAYTNHNTNTTEPAVEPPTKYSNESMLHAQFALYAMDIDYFFAVGLGNQADYDKLNFIVNSKASGSPTANYKGITLPARGVETGSSPYVSTSQNSLHQNMRDIADIIKNVKVNNVVVEDKLSQYAIMAKNSSGQYYPLEIKVLDSSGNVTGSNIGNNRYRLNATANNGAADIVAAYDDTTKAISLKFPANYTLETGYKYSVTAKIKASPQAESVYSTTGNFQKNPDGSFVLGDAGTGSKSSNQKGFYSNDLAKVVYKYKNEEINDVFKKPVIQPVINPVPTGVGFEINYALIFIIMSIFSVMIFYFNRRKRY